MGLPGDLGEIDVLLDDPVFFEPFRAFFDPVIGRPSIPMETYLRMMFLKYRYRLGFEPLCREVADSLAWRRFCRVPLGTSAPHPTTLMKITSRCGEKAVAGLNEALLAKAAGAKVIRLDKLRADTTVVEANVSYPTDSGLLAKGVAKLAQLSKKIRTVASPPARRSGTAPDRCAAEPMPSRPGCAGATTTPRPRSRPSPPRWRASPRPLWPTPAIWLPTHDEAWPGPVRKRRPRQRRW